MDPESPVGELHGSVLAALGTGIVSGHYQAGRALTLDGVSAAHGVSRSVVREAVRVLESMGMVTPRRRIGITIEPSSRWNVLDPRLIRWRLDSGDRVAQLRSLAELRRGVEPAAAALAAQRADPQQCRSMAAAVSDMVVHGRSGDLDAFLLADKLFHRTLLEASGNEMFRALYEVVAEVLVDRALPGAEAVRPDPAVTALHDEVARAVRMRDAAAAERAMRAIIDQSAAVTTAAPA